MKFTRLGHSGLVVSRLCLGCMSYGTPAWRPWVLDEAQSEPFFRRAVELGINFFDTADMYSDGVSEEVTGRALKKYARAEEVVIATKVHFPTGKGPNMKGLSAKHLVQACEASLRRLGVETIDLYQVHRFDAQTPIEETLAALERLVQQGKVRYLGASSGYAWELMRALGVSERRGWARFISMQGHYNLVYREEEREMLPLCEAEGLGVIPWSPLARGMLAGGRKGAGDHTSTRRAGSDAFADRLYDHPADWDVVAAVRQVAEARGLPMAQIALAWLHGKPRVTAPIVGATRMQHLEDAVASLKVKLTDEEVAALEAPYVPHGVKA